LTSTAGLLEAAARRRAERDGVPSVTTVAPQRLLSRIAAGLLAFWCGLGLWFSGERLMSPQVGWRVARSEDLRGTIGLPLAESGPVNAIQELIELADAPDGPWLVVYPPDIDEVSVEYVRSQLRVVDYPRHIDVVKTTGSAPRRDYVGTVLHPRVNLRADGGPGLEHRGFVAHLRNSP
jgi:hypothetical protein